jgi:hypothetical protein
VLEIHAHGYAYRQRPLSQASRSQRIFYALAKSFAALPKIPPHVAAAAAVSVPSTPTSVTEGSEDDDEAPLGADADLGEMDRGQQNGTAEGEALEKLLSVGGRAGDRAAEKEVLQEAASTTSSPPDDEHVAPATSEEPDEMSLEEQLRSPTARDFATSQHPPPTKPARSATAPTPAPIRNGSTDEDNNEEAAILSTPAKLSRRPGFRIEIPPSPASLANAKRAGTASQPGSPTGGAASPLRSPGFRSAAFNFVKRDRHKTKTQDSYNTNATSEFELPGSSSKRSSAASSRASSRASSPVRGSHLRTTPHHHHPRHRDREPPPSVPLPPETWPAPFTLPSDPHALPRLHTNLHTRLLPFFGLKLANRKIRVSAYPALAEGQLYDGVLASTVVRTSATSGGGFKTCLEVRGPELRKWLDLVGNGSGGARGGGLDTLRVRVVAELLEPDPLVPSVVDTAPFSGVGFGNSNKDAAAAHASAIATAVDEVELDVGIQGEGGEGGGVRIVSDVDDTIKVRMDPANRLGKSRSPFTNTRHSGLK